MGKAFFYKLGSDVTANRRDIALVNADVGSLRSRVADTDNLRRDFYEERTRVERQFDEIKRGIREPADNGVRGRLTSVEESLGALRERVGHVAIPAEELLESARGITSDLAAQISRLEKRLATVEAATAIDARGILSEGDGTAGETLDESIARDRATRKAARKARGK